MRVYTYLRASTKDPDASRAKSALLEFAKPRQQEISKLFTTGSKYFDWCWLRDNCLKTQSYGAVMLMDLNSCERIRAAAGTGNPEFNL